MHDEDENVIGDAFDLEDTEDLDVLEGGEVFEAEEEDSYDPDDRFH